MKHTKNAARRIVLAKLAFVVMAGTAYANQPYHFQAPLGVIVAQVSDTSAQGQRTLTLAAGTELVRGERYWSASGAHFLILNPDGNLVVARADGGYVWGLDTQPNVEFTRIARVVWQGDGVLAAYAADGSLIWSTRMENPDPTAQLVLQPSGALQIIAGAEVKWTSIEQRTLPLAAGTELVRGERYWSQSGEHFLTLNPDGNLVVARADGGYVWGLDTQPNVEFTRIARVVWQGDGVLAAYAADGSTIWSTRMESPDPTAQLVLQPNGALEIVAANTVMWSSLQAAPLQGGASAGDDDRTVEQSAADQPELAELQPPVEAGAGEVQVTLLWATGDDLDLYVTEPNGFVIYWDTQLSDSGGLLDLDNRGDRTETCRSQEARAENVFWRGSAPRGTYTVEVKNFVESWECNQLVPAKIQVRVGGNLIVDQIISVGEDQPIRFNIR